MSLVKRPNSRFWYVQFQINHVTVVRSTRTTDRRIAEKVALRVRADAHAEIVLGRRNPMTLEHALDRFVGSRAGPPNHPNLVSHRNTLLTLSEVFHAKAIVTAVDKQLDQDNRLELMEYLALAGGTSMPRSRA